MHSFWVLGLMLLISCPGSFGSDGELLQVFIIARHGDRSPTRVFPKTKSEWPKGLGQLSHIGAKQHFNLGQHFRQKYILEKQFVGASFHPNEVYVRSTPKERTLASAQSFLLGMFPPTNESETGLPFGIQAVPIFSSQRKDDRLLYAYKICPRMKDLKKNADLIYQEEQMTHKHQKTLSRLSEMFGFPVKLKDVTSIVNLLHAEEIHNKTRSAQVEEETWKEMLHITEWVFRRKFHNKEMGILGGGHLVAEIGSKFVQAQKRHSSNSSSPIEHRLTFFSAHDGTLLALMAALEWTHILHVPHYASQFVFELHYNTPSYPQEYAVKIYYDGVPVALPQCSTTCPLTTFLQLTNDSIPFNWEEDCRPLRQMKIEVSGELVNIQQGSHLFTFYNVLCVLGGFAVGYFFSSIKVREKLSKSPFKDVY